MKHRIICNILLAILFGYRIYLVLGSENYHSFFNGALDSLIDIIFYFLWKWLPFIVIAIGFLANFFKHPIDVVINSLCIGLSILSFFNEGFIFITDMFDGCAHDFVKPSINIFTLIIAIVSIFCSTVKYEKKKKSDLLNSKNS